MGNKTLGAQAMPTVHGAFHIKGGERNYNFAGTSRDADTEAHLVRSLLDR